MATFTGHGITMFALVNMKARFKMELLGLKGRGPTMYSLIKQNYGFKGNRESVYAQFCEYIEQQKQLLSKGDIN